ncbi:hypothetical protein [Paraburkholderia sp. J67]|nr:hypothetical protein [Paraburkholderia sp. J67]
MKIHVGSDGFFVGMFRKMLAQMLAQTRTALAAFARFLALARTLGCVK